MGYGNKFPGISVVEGRRSARAPLPSSSGSCNCRGERPPICRFRSQQLDDERDADLAATSQGVKDQAGLGLQGRVHLFNMEPLHVAIGSRKIMVSLGIAVGYTAVPEQARCTVGGTVYIAIQHFQAGIILCEDVIRPKSKAAVQALLRRGINVDIVTGDSFASASLVARLVGIHAENIFADLLPMEKSEVVLDMRRRGSVSFVGEGLNDVTAFASSSFSIYVLSDRFLGLSPLPALADAYLLPLGSRSTGSDADLVERKLRDPATVCPWIELI
jgi:hypothetical protein